MAASRSKKSFGGGGVLSLLIIPVIASFLIGTASADTKDWTGIVDNSWKVGGNWLSLGVPKKGDSVFIKTTGDKVDYDNPENPTLRYFEIDDPFGIAPRPTLLQEQGTLTTRETVIGLTKGISLYDQRGGTHRTVVDGLCEDHPCGDLSLGHGGLSWGDYTLLKGVLSVGGNEWVGVFGEGHMNQGDPSVFGEANPTLGCTPPVDPLHTVGKNLIWD